MQMKTTASILGALATLGLVAGCSEPYDKGEAGQKMEGSAENTVDTVGEAARDAAAATTLTPDIKAAIVANDSLNDPSNLINVESTDEKVVLEGYVRSQEQKDLAEQIARKTLLERNAKQVIENKLEVR